jgi:hypothetical protein
VCGGQPSPHKPRLVAQLCIRYYSNKHTRLKGIVPEAPAHVSVFRFLWRWQWRATMRVYICVYSWHVKLLGRTWEGDHVWRRAGANNSPRVGPLVLNNHSTLVLLTFHCTMKREHCFKRATTSRFRERQSVLFIGTQFSNLYTTVDTKSDSRQPKLRH